MRVETTPQRQAASRSTTPQLTARLLVAALVLAAAPGLLFAQVKDMGPAGQFYNQPKPKFRVTPGLKKKGGDVKFSAKVNDQFVRDEYPILTRHVAIQHQHLL